MDCVFKWYEKFLRRILGKQMSNLQDSISGLESDLSELVNQIRKATDLDKLKELTELNYPEE